MSKPIKDMVSTYLRQRYEGVDSACVVDLTGLNVASTEKIRAGLRSKQARLEVVNNGLARRAFRDTPLQPLAVALQGPSALVTGGDSLVDIAKALVQLAKEFDKLTLKQAILEGDPGLLTVAELSRMKSRMEILGDVAALIGGPGRRLASAIGSPAGRIAGCVKTIADRSEAGPESGN